jgi:hypothetical protein
MKITFKDTAMGIPFFSAAFTERYVPIKQASINIATKSGRIMFIPVFDLKYSSISGLINFLSNVNFLTTELRVSGQQTFMDTL